MRKIDLGPLEPIVLGFQMGFTQPRHNKEIEGNTVHTQLYAVYFYTLYTCTHRDIVKIVESDYFWHLTRNLLHGNVNMHTWICDYAIEGCLTLQGKQFGCKNHVRLNAVIVGYVINKKNAKKLSADFKSWP